jgi:hypothetical protein
MLLDIPKDIADLMDGDGDVLVYCKKWSSSQQIYGKYILLNSFTLFPDYKVVKNKEIYFYLKIANFDKIRLIPVKDYSLEYVYFYSPISGWRCTSVPKNVPPTLKINGKSVTPIISSNNIPDIQGYVSPDVTCGTFKHKPKNNDGRDTCYWCKAPTKKIQGLIDMYDICTKCGK